MGGEPGSKDCGYQRKPKKREVGVSEKCDIPCADDYSQEKQTDSGSVPFAFCEELDLPKMSVEV